MVGKLSKLSKIVFLREAVLNAVVASFGVTVNVASVEVILARAERFEVWVKR